MSRNIRFYDYVNHPYEQVRDVLAGDALSVFHDATKTAASRVSTLASELRINVAGLDIGTDIAITVGSVEERAGALTSPMTRLTLEWEAAKSPRLFPFMQAELLVYPLTSTETQLEFQGNYDPPLGVLGEAMDAIAGHRIAEASVHRFLKDVAAFLKTELAR